VPLQAARIAIAVVALACASTGATPREPAGMQEGVTTSCLSFDVRGRGPVVVLVHGAMLDRRQWAPQDELARQVRLVRYDTRWHGTSAAATESFTAADDLAEVLDAVGATRATVVGLSNGARIAVNFALAHPTRVSGLVLASPDLEGWVPTERPAFWGPLAAALGAGDVDSAARVLANSPIMEVPARDSGWVKGVVRDNAKVFRGKAVLERRGVPPAIERLHEIAVPTLVLAGTDDLKDIRGAAERLASGVRAARLVQVPGARHLLSITHAPEFNRVVGEFVRGVGR